MVGTVKQGEFDIDHREASEYATSYCITQTFVHRWNKFTRDNTTLDGIDKLIALAGFIWLDFEPNMTELTATT